MRLVDSHLNFIKIKWEITLFWRYSSSPQTFVNKSISIELTNLLTTYNSIRCIKKLEYNDFDRCWRSQVKVKGNKNEQILISRKLIHPQT